MISQAGSRASKLLGFAQTVAEQLQNNSVLRQTALRCVSSSPFSKNVENILGAPRGQIPSSSQSLKPYSQFHRGFAAQPCPVDAPVAPGIAPHPGIQEDLERVNSLEDDDKCKEFHNQPHYPDKNYLESIKPFHRKPTTMTESTGYYAVQAMRRSFDFLTAYGSEMTSQKWLMRFLFLETVAGVPGMVGGMMRHLRSLRTMKRDKGWIHTLLEEAENERMHLLTFMDMYQPGPIFRAAVIGTQGVFMTLYTLFYAISPRHCHAFVSYLEEEAVKTYTHCIEDIDNGNLPEWKSSDEVKVPDIAVKYWRLGKKASVRDLILAIRADELCHSHVNQVFATIKKDDPNPFSPGTTVVA